MGTKDGQLEIVALSGARKANSYAYDVDGDAEQCGVALGACHAQKIDRCVGRDVARVNGRVGSRVGG